MKNEKVPAPFVIADTDQMEPGVIQKFAEDAEHLYQCLARYISAREIYTMVANDFEKRWGEYGAMSSNGQDE